MLAVRSNGQLGEQIVNLYILCLQVQLNNRNFACFALYAPLKTEKQTYLTLSFRILALYFRCRCFCIAVIGVTAAVELVAADGIAVVAATDANDLVSQGLCSSFKFIDFECIWV